MHDIYGEEAVVVLRVGVGRRIVIPKDIAEKHGVKDGGYVNIKILGVGNTIEEAVRKSAKTKPKTKTPEKPMPKT